MPRAFTNCTEVLSTKISKKSLVEITKRAKKTGVSRAIYLDRLILKHIEEEDTLSLETPEYKSKKKKVSREKLSIETGV